MIFIAGVQPRTKTLDNNPRLCPLCGNAEAYLKRVDHYLSIFFIPIVPVSRGKPAIICERCGGISDEMGHGIGARRVGGELSCKHCGRVLEREFAFCPYCGKRI
jgi:rubrerythrin